MAESSVHARGDWSNLVYSRYFHSPHCRKKVQSLKGRSTSQSDLASVPQKGLQHMTVRMLTTETRRRLEEVLTRLGNGVDVSLEERIQLKKYATHIPFLASKLRQALRKRESLESDGLI